MANFVFFLLHCRMQISIFGFQLSTACYRVIISRAGACKHVSLIFNSLQLAIVIVINYVQALGWNSARDKTVHSTQR